MLKRTGKWPRQHNSTEVQACCEHSLIEGATLHELWKQLFLLFREIMTNAFSAVTPPLDTQRLLPKRAARLPPLLKKKTTHAGTANVFGSEAKSKYATYLLLIKYSRCSAEQLLQLLHANVHWLVLLSLEVDWSPKVIPNSSASSEVRRTWPTERELQLAFSNFSDFNCRHNVGYIMQFSADMS